MNGLDVANLTVEVIIAILAAVGNVVVVFIIAINNNLQVRI